MSNLTVQLSEFLYKKIQALTTETYLEELKWRGSDEY